MANTVNDLIEVVLGMVVGAIGGLIVKEVVDAANYTGLEATIAGLFTFVLLSIVIIRALMSTGKR